MKKIFLSLILNLQIVKFDTQDNLVKTCDGQWSQNVNLDTFEPLGPFGLWRFDNHKIWFKSTTPIKTIRLNNFPYQYKVKKVSPYHFIIKSGRMQDYFDNTDIVEIIVKK